MKDIKNKIFFGSLRNAEGSQKEKCIGLLQKLIKKQYILFTDRGNTSIRLALELMKVLKKKKNLIQDQGGWLTYKDFSKELGLEAVELETDYGLLNLKLFSIPDNSFFLINSMPAYAFYEDMKKIFKLKKMLINDISGSIGTKYAKYGNIVVCSFGKWKTINCGGGLIATNNYDFFKYFENSLATEANINFEELYQQLDNISTTIKKKIKINKKIKKDLKDMEIIHKKQKGFNVIVKYKDDEEKGKIINYCNENKYPFVECPKYIRVNEKAISIEVKRL